MGNSLKGAPLTFVPKGRYTSSAYGDELYLEDQSDATGNLITKRVLKLRNGEEVLSLQCLIDGKVWMNTTNVPPGTFAAYRAMLSK